MNLIERYLKEVERHLPRRMREDVARELRSGIEDAVDSRTGDDPERREEIIAQVLREYGDPVKIARSYLPDRYLVGPRHYDAFLTTTKVTLTVLAALVGVGLAAKLITADGTVGESLLLLVEALSRFPASAATFLGIIVVVFAVIERVAEPGAIPAESNAQWDPACLPQAEDRDRINRISLTVDACFYVGLFVLFNFFHDYFRVVGQTDGVWWFIPLDLAGFAPYLFWLNIWWVASLVTTVMILRDGRWFTSTRLLKIVLAAVLVVLLLRLAHDPDALALPAGWHAAFPDVDASLVEITDTVFPILTGLLRIGALVAAVILAIDTVKRAVRLALGR